MNKKYNYIFMALSMIIIILIIINCDKNIETFTPGVRQMYRPIIRGTRIQSEQFTNNIKSQTSNLLRKFNLV